MKKFLSLVVSFALLAILARPSIAQREEPVPKSLEGQAAAPRGRGVPPEIGGYVTPLGSFDVKPNGIFQYIFGDRFWVRRAAFVQEDSSFWYFKETVPATGWNWAIPKQAGGDGKYQLWIQPYQRPWQRFDKGVRAPTGV